MPNPNPIDGRYQNTVNADARNAQYRKIIQQFISEQTTCLRCRTLSFCEPKCVSWNSIVGMLNTTGVPTPSRARKGMPIKQLKLLPEGLPEDASDDLVSQVIRELNKQDTGVWDSVQVKRVMRVQGKRGLSNL